MKIDNYFCDKCGKELLGTDESSYRWHLQVYFPNMSHSDPNHNLGIRHLCTDCRNVFIKTFRRWFKFYNSVTKGNMK